MRLLSACIIAGLIVFSGPMLAAQQSPEQRDSLLRHVIYVGGPSFYSDLRAGTAPGIRTPDSTSRCLADTGWVLPLRLRRIRDVLSDADSMALEVRKSIGHLPTVDSSHITPVTDRALCARAATLVTWLFDWTGNDGVYLVKAGPLYVVFPPGVGMGEWGVAIYADAALEPLGLSVW